MSTPAPTKTATPMRVLAVLLGYGQKLGVPGLFLDLAGRQVKAERREVGLVADIAGRAREALHHFNLTLHACNADGVITPEEQAILDNELSAATSLTERAQTRAQTLAAE